METAANAVAEGAAASDGQQEGAESATVRESVEAAKPDTTGSEPEWFKKRFDEITGRFRSEERRAVAAEQRAAQLERELRQRQQQPASEEPTKTLEDFGYDDRKYQDYLFGVAEKRAVEAAKRVRQEEQEQTSRATRARKFQEREVEFEKQTKDYREVAHYAPISQDLADIITEMESGPEVAYFLGKNRAVALSLNDLPPRIAAIELGRIDAKLSAEKATKAAALEAARLAKAVSQAPPPAGKIEGAGEAGSIDLGSADSDSLSDAEWARRREKQVKRQRK